METYPSINNIISNQPIIAFDKLDGSNIRAEWSRKTGFTKFGTRKRLLDENEQPLGEAIPLFMEKYAEELDKVFRKNRLEKMTAFFEFYGANSFAGFHENEPHEVMLFDIHQYKKGMLPPKEFLKLVGDTVPTVPILFEGKATQEFIQSVKESTLEGMSLEGVVCKGGLDNRRRPVAFKIKSQAWLDKLKTKYADNPALMQKLI